MNAPFWCHFVSFLQTTLLYGAWRLIYLAPRTDILAVEQLPETGREAPIFGGTEPWKRQIHEKNPQRRENFHTSVH